MRILPSRGAAFCVIVISLQLCSCKEHLALFKEKADLEVVLQKTKEETALFESKLGAIGQPLPTATAALEAQIKAADKASTELSLEVSDLSGKTERLDAAIKQFRPKVETYKAKYLR